LEHSDRRLLGICLDQCSHPSISVVVLVTGAFNSINRNSKGNYKEVGRLIKGVMNARL
jgi:hypothetical protein